MIKQSGGVGVVILAVAGLLLSSCGATAATLPTGKTVCSPEGGWCLTLHRTLTSAAVTVTCPTRACTEATFLAVTHAGHEAEGRGAWVRAVAPGPKLHVIPMPHGPCADGPRPSTGSWCSTGASWSASPVWAGGPAPVTTVRTPSFWCATSCPSGWSIVATGRAHGHPWRLVLSLPVVRPARAE